MTPAGTWIFEAPLVHEMIASGEAEYTYLSSPVFAREVAPGSHYAHPGAQFAAEMEAYAPPVRRATRRVTSVRRRAVPSPAGTRIRRAAAPPRPTGAVARPRAARPAPGRSGGAPSRGKASVQAFKKFKALRGAYAQRLGVGKGGQVHHAIERQVLDRYPGVFTERQINDFRNMRGIPGEFSDETYRRREQQLRAALAKRGLQPGSAAYNKYVRDFHGKAAASALKRKQLHNAKIREMWNRHYHTLDEQLRQRGLKPGTPQYNTYVRQYLTTARDEIDWALGQFFSEYRKAQDWTPSAQRP